jgi:hypothetical protein
MGWYIMEPSTVKTAGQMCIDVEDWEEFEIAFSHFRRYRNRIVFIPHGVKEAPEFNPFNGLFHFAYKIQTLIIAKIVSYGGNKECLFENIIQIRSLLKCAM